MVIELCPAIFAKVNASQPASPKRVNAVCRRQYGSNGFTPDSFSERACWFFALF